MRAGRAPEQEARRYRHGAWSLGSRLVAAPSSLWRCAFLVVCENLAQLFLLALAGSCQSDCLRQPVIGASWCNCASSTACRGPVLTAEKKKANLQCLSGEFPWTVWPVTGRSSVENLSTKGDPKAFLYYFFHHDIFMPDFVLPYHQ